MQTWILRVTLFVLLACGAAAQAQQCSPVKTAVYYGNGVGRGIPTFNDAFFAKQNLQAGVLGMVSSSREQEYEFLLAYNNSAGMALDIIESARQTLGAEWPTLLMGILLGNRLIMALIPADAMQRMNDLLASRAVQQMVNPALANSDIARQLRNYQNNISEGKKIVLVAHSQGNIYANRLHDNLSGTEKAYFAIVPVASPESFVRRSYVGHVRFLDDHMINLVQAAKFLANLPVPLGANDQDNIDDDWTGHEFVRSYLADSSSRRFITTGVLTSESSMNQPTQSAGQGIITVTLKWGAQPDVDLHMYEPNGTHIYYASPQGSFGKLDVDDTNGFGPEHIFVDCQKLRASPNAMGRYRVALNYYQGSGPESANVTVKAPGIAFETNKSLPASRGSSGDNSPVRVVDVIVSRDEVNGSFTFKIEP